MASENENDIFYKLTRKLTEVNPEISRKCTKSRGQNRRKDWYKSHAQSPVVTQNGSIDFLFLRSLHNDFEMILS